MAVTNRQTAHHQISGVLAKEAHTLRGTSEDDVFHPPENNNSNNSDNSDNKGSCHT
jgi:hypothetical protein